MIFSVYDYPSGKYSYYEAPAELPAAGWFRQPLGEVPVPEAIAAPLPPGAKFVGQGEKARGIIATKSASLSSLQSLLPRPVPGFLKTLAFVGFGFWLGRKYR